MVKLLSDNKHLAQHVRARTVRASPQCRYVDGPRFRARYISARAAKVAVIRTSTTASPLRSAARARPRNQDQEVAGGLSQDGASSPIRPTRSARARRFRSGRSRLGAEHGLVRACDARTGPGVRSEHHRRGRAELQGENTGSEVAAVARGADHACARRLRLCATLCSARRSPLRRSSRMRPRMVGHSRRAEMWRLTFHDRTLNDLKAPVIRPTPISRPPSPPTTWRSPAPTQR